MTEQRSLDLTFKLDKDSSIVDFLIKLNDSNRSNNYRSVELYGEETLSEIQEY
ncbi:MAG: hypothetical protein CM15mP102_12130 [Flavobacteriales bacterium]|nr:MAG: hypothetical protein CM15mP102_12130 [Flavobacteriales bacterium]